MFEMIEGWTPANKQFLGIGLALTLSFQMLVLATEYLSSVWPLWFGTPIVLKTAPVDPRSLFRGNYVRLNYDISRIDKGLAKDNFKRGEVAYVTLEKGMEKEKELYVAAGLQREKPDSGIYIRGRVTQTGGSYRMKYGIEAFFMPKEKALKAERSVRQGATAEVFLLDSGKAAIANLSCDSGDC